jgi:ADP-heptose:LPS heptosyltransferase
VNLSLAKAADRVVGRAIAGAFAVADAVGDALRPPLPPVERVRCLLVQKYWGVGNWALLRPVVRDLRARWPGARLVVATLASNGPLVEDLADEVVRLRPRGLLPLAGDLAAALTAVRRAAPEVSLDFEQFASAGAILARAAGVPQRIGFASGSRARDALLTVRVPFRRDVHAARSFRDLAEAAGVPRGPYVPGGLAPSERGAAEAARALAAVGLRGDGPLVVLHPGSGDNFPGRRWSAAGFAAVGRLAVARHGARVVVTGSGAEGPLCARVAQDVGHGAASVAGRTGLEGLVGVLARARAVVSNDTGPVHLASALGVPVLALFGPNTPVLYGPLAQGSRAFFVGFPCSPCLTTDNYRSSRCRLHTCMAAIPTGEVATALDRLLSHPDPVATPCAPRSSSSP